MFSRALYSAAVAIAAAALVSAQTSTDCNPMKKTCPANKAIGNSKFFCDFAKPCPAVEQLADPKVEYDAGKGAIFTISKDSDPPEAPTMRSIPYMFFGELSVKIKAAAGKGIVTSFFLLSDLLDEIDLEWVGGNDTHFQTNYFSKGKTANYNRDQWHPVANPVGQYHTYKIHWTSDFIKWYVDGTLVRTLEAANAQGGIDGFPQTPMRARFGIWVGGRLSPDGSDGTALWAGGMTDFKEAPFVAYYKDLTMIDYAGGNGPATGGVKEYRYKDMSGSWEQIEVVPGDNGGSNSESSGSDGSDSSSSDSSSSDSSSTSTGKKPAKSADKSDTKTASPTESSDSQDTEATATSRQTSEPSDTATSATATSRPGATSSSSPASGTLVPGSAAAGGVAGLWLAAGLLAAQLLL